MADYSNLIDETLEGQNSGAVNDYSGLIDEVLAGEPPDMTTTPQPEIRASNSKIKVGQNINVIEEQSPEISGLERTLYSVDRDRLAGVVRKMVPEDRDITVGDDGRLLIQEAYGSSNYFPIDPYKTFSISEGVKELIQDNPAETATGVASLASGGSIPAIARLAAAEGGASLGKDYIADAIANWYGVNIPKKELSERFTDAAITTGLSSVGGMGGKFVQKGGGIGVAKEATEKYGKQIVDALADTKIGQSVKSYSEKATENVSSILKAKPKEQVGKVEKYIKDLVSPNSRARRMAKNMGATSDDLNPAKNRIFNIRAESDGIIDNILYLDSVKTPEGISVAQKIYKGSPFEVFSSSQEVADQAIDGLAKYKDKLESITVPFEDVWKNEGIQDLITSATSTKAKNASLKKLDRKILNELLDTFHSSEGIGEALEEAVTKGNWVEEGGGMLLKPTEQIPWEKLSLEKKLETFESVMGNTQLTMSDLINMKQTTDTVVRWNTVAGNAHNEARRQLANGIRKSYKEQLSLLGEEGATIAQLEELIHHAIPVRELAGKATGMAWTDRKGLVRFVPSPLFSLPRAAAQSAERILSSQPAQSFIFNALKKAEDFSLEGMGQGAEIPNAVKRLYGIGKKVGNAGVSLGKGLAQGVRATAPTAGLVGGALLNEEATGALPVPSDTQSFYDNPEVYLRNLEATLPPDKVEDINYFVRSPNFTPEGLTQKLLMLKSEFPDAFDGGFGIDGYLAPHEIEDYDMMIKNLVRSGEMDNTQRLQEENIYKQGKFAPQPYLSQGVQPRATPMPAQKQAEPTINASQVLSKAKGLSRNNISEVSGRKREVLY
jgi:hypothetical protein